MLAEMTRAFNVGFGLGAHGIGGTPTSGSNSQGESVVTPDTNTNTQESPDSVTPPLATLPPEGSFDRFLMDLQIDLRTALTQVEDLPHTPAPQTRRLAPSELVRQPQEAEAGTENANGNESSSTLRTLPETQPVVYQHEDYRAQGPPEGIHAANVDPGRSSIPDLSEVYDTESEFGDAEEDSDDDGTLFFHPFSFPAYRTELNP
jgi:hypothetical protein